MLIFIVEDDEWYKELLKYHLELNPDDEIYAFSSGKELTIKLKLNPDIVCLDFSLPEYTGDILLKKIKNNNPETEVVIISGQEDVGTAIGLLHEGAFDYILKDNDTKDRLWSVINRIRENKTLKKEIKDLKQKIGSKFTQGKAIIGEHPKMKMALQLVKKSLNSKINISLTGETGTGKEIFAQHIHYNSNRSKKPFVPVNVSAIPKDLMESELFGHEKGAFTGATSTRIGKFEEANKGTLFLDEIGELDITMQAKLLRAIQEREITRVGGTKTIKLDLRIISATHKNLITEIANKNFRQDLFFRLYGIEIELPPLRDRGDDIFLITKNIIYSFCQENGMDIKTLSEESKEKLKKHNFPGNVRELKAIIELSCILADHAEIKPEDIQIKSTLSLSKELLGEEKTLKEYTIDIIQYYLNKNNSNVIETAKILGVGKSTIYRMVSANEIKLT